MTYLLGIDIGTTGVKTLLIDSGGRVLATALEEYPLSVPKPGWAEQDADDWWAAAVRSIRKIVDSVDGCALQIAAVGLSGQMHGLVPLDNNRRPIRPAILWCDQRTSAECEQLENKFGTRFLEITGNPPLTGFTLPKILWMRNNEPELFSRITSFLLPKDYVRLMLTGEVAMDISDAAGTVMFDVARGAWATELLSELGLPESMLPPVFGSAEVCGRITSETAEATGLKEGTPVVAGGADNTCGAVGAGIVKNGRVSSSIGSSGVIFAHTDKAAKDPQGRVHTFNHSVPGAYYLMGVMLSAGLSFRWLRDTLAVKEKEREAAGGGDAYTSLSRVAQTAPAGSEGLLFLPYLCGERTPHKDPHARGVFFGLSLAHGYPHLVRAVMEGIIFGLKDSLDIISELGVRINEIRAIGGGAKSDFWRQMQADVFGKPVAKLNHDEGPAFGAALLAGVGAGVYEDVEGASDATVKVVSASLPREEYAEIYYGAHKRYKGLYAALKDSFKEF